MTLNALTAIFFQEQSCTRVVKILPLVPTAEVCANTTFGILELGIPHFSQHFSPLPG